LRSSRRRSVSLASMIRNREAASSSRASALATASPTSSERLEPPLRFEREHLFLAERDDQRAPGAACDRDRHADAATEAECSQLDRAGAGQPGVVGPRRSSGPQHLQRRAGFELDDVTELEPAGGLAELADDRRRLRVLEAVEHRRPQLEQPADLLRHRLEHLLGGGVPGHERCHTPERGLLSGEAPLPLLGATLLGDVTQDRHDLLFAARNHPGLPPVHHSLDLQVVLDRGQAAGLQRAVDAGEDGASELVREHVADIPADELVRSEQ